MQLCSDRSNKILTIPNLLSAFRLVLAGVFAGTPEISMTTTWRWAFWCCPA